MEHPEYHYNMGDVVIRLTPNPQPSTLHPTPYTLHPTPSRLNLNPQTLNPSLRTQVLKPYTKTP